VILPLLRHWGVFDLKGLDAQGEQARTELAAFLARLDAQANRFEEQRARTLAKVTASHG
jgi:acyl-[acyl-carrier-protein] desaturase